MLCFLPLLTAAKGFDDKSVVKHCIVSAMHILTSNSLVKKIWRMTGEAHSLLQVRRCSIILLLLLSSKHASLRVKREQGHV